MVIMGYGSDHGIHGAGGDHFLPVGKEGIVRILFFAHGFLGGIRVAECTKSTVGRTLGSRHSWETGISR